MSAPTPLQRRAARRGRNPSMVDMNLVSLIDVFTILIFFLLSNSAEVEVLPSTRAVKLPESTAEKSPRDTVVVIVNATDIVVQGLKVAAVEEVLAAPGDEIAALKAELDLQAGRRLIRTTPAPSAAGAPAAAAATAGPKPNAVTIMGDRNIPYRLLRKVMVTCARANFSDVSFAVRPKGDS